MTLFEFTQKDFTEQISYFKSQVKPSYLLESPYRDVLMAIAKGDSKIYSSIKKARLNEQLGERIVNDLKEMGIIRFEDSKELHTNSSKKYRIQSKLRFNEPFLRFWFGFVEAYMDEIKKGKTVNFIENFKAHYERLRSLVFEQLSEEFVNDYYRSKGIKILFSGSYWDKENEFDIFAITDKFEIILGECKYKDRKVCKSELTKLKAKALQSHLTVKEWVLFSKQGFSEELKSLKDRNLLLFDLHDMSKWG